MTGWLKNIVEALSNGATVVTVNRRLSQCLRSAYKEFKLSSGKVAWETPPVMPVGAWVSKLYEESCSAGPVLTESRSRALWTGIVERGFTADERSVLFAQGVGETSYSAYKLMGEYCLTAPGLGPELYMSEEALAFKGWLRAYNRKLKTIGFTDVTLLKSLVAESIKRGELKLPGSLLFAGFDEFTPAVKRLFDYLKESGVDVKDVGSDTSGETAPPVIKEYADEVEEVRAAARRVREKLTAGGSVGVIVTDLNRYHGVIEREFSAELDPLSVLPWKSAAGVFNISLGSPLYDNPLVRSAFSLLSIVTPETETGPVMPLLYSISTGERCRGEIARFDVCLKSKKRASLSLKELKDLLEEDGKGSLAEVTSKVGKWVELLKKESSKEYPGCWAGRFASALRLLGWPGAGGADGGGLRSEEYQVVEAWRSVLVEFSCLDDTLGLLTRSGAVAQLRRLAVETVHQVESQNSPVQVLGLFEAAGQHFEHLLLLGADSSTLPAPQNPNPFIQIEVQKRLNFKDSTPERTLAFARTVLERVLKSGIKVEVSYASTFDGAENLISPLLRGVTATPIVLPGKETLNITPGSSLKERLYAACVLERFPEEPDMPLSSEETGVLRGGTGIIKEQSACPFRAFAMYRLGARGIDKVTPGFDPADRGTAVHEALKLFWQEVKNSKRLKEAKENGELPALTGKAVSRVFAKYAGRNLPASYIELERLRTVALVSEWLALELTRQDFSVIDVECDKEIEVGGLKLRARLDRIDRLANGAEVIIDYKTGECKKDYWLPGRPKEPQLLLYDLAGSFDVVAFAHLKINKTKFVGVAKEGLELPGIKSFEEDKWTLKIEGVENWNDLKAVWRETLESIAKEFASGVASVTPDSTFDHSGHPCTFCCLTTLCRRFELNVGPGRGF